MLGLLPTKYYNSLISGNIYEIAMDTVNNQSSNYFIQLGLYHTNSNMPIIDDEWIELFEFQRNYREHHSITATVLIKALGLDPKRYCRFLYSEKERPPLRQNAILYPIRAKLREFKNSVDDTKITVPNEELSREERIVDLNYSKRDYFQQLGISEIYSDENITTIEVATNKPMTPQEAYEIIVQASNDPDIIGGKEIVTTTWYPA